MENKRLTFKYRIYANKQTLEKAEYWLKLCRFLYNSALNQRVLAYKQNHKSISYYDQQNELPELKKIMPEYKEVGAQTLGNVLHRLDEAFKAFFKRRNGFPRYKGKNRYDSFTLTQSNWKLIGNKLYVYKLGVFKIKLSRPIQGDIKAITIRKTKTNKWYVNFSCNNVLTKELPKTDKIVGLDVGIKSFLVDSECNKIDNNKYLKHLLSELRVKQRKLARREKTSNRRKKALLFVSKTHEKIDNQRSDFQHKLANEYIKNYGFIVFEDLKIKNMVKMHTLARDINDCSWGQFFRLLTYKAEYAGRLIFKDNPRFTSQNCHVCGTINHELKLSDREWICLECGTWHDRDVNAAMNLKNDGIKYLKERFGQSHQALTYENTHSVV